MAEIKDVFSKKVGLEIQGENASWRVVYDPSRWSVRWHVRSYEEVIEYAEIISVLSKCVLEWDLTLDGDPVPCNEETMWDLPRNMVSDLQRHIMWNEMGFNPSDVTEGKSQKGQAKKKPTRRGSRQRKRQTTSK